MKIASVSYSHNASLSILEKGKIIYFIEEERLSRIKNDSFCKNILKKLNNYDYDFLLISGLERCYFEQEELKNSVSFLDRHHLTHAACGFYNSGFKEAAIIVVDGVGSHLHNNVYEGESVFVASYPANFNIIIQNTFVINKENKINQNLTVGRAFEIVSEYIGFNTLDAGKTMGLSAYGKNNKNIPEFFTPYFNSVYPNVLIDKTFNKKDLAFAVQRDTEKRLEYLINETIKKTNLNQFVLTGGYALNCVNNFKVLQKFPEIEFFIEPISSDSGCSYGAAKYWWHLKTSDKTIRTLTSLYLGHEQN